MNVHTKSAASLPAKVTRRQLKNARIPMPLHLAGRVGSREEEQGPISYLRRKEGNQRRKHQELGGGPNLSNKSIAVYYLSLAYC
jgi:hypothetical protein